MVAKQVVIFDLGGVLLSEAEVNLHKTDSPVLQELLFREQPRRIFNRAFEFAALLYGKECKSLWILGELSGNEIVTKIKEHIDSSEFDSFFVDEYERLLIKHGIEFILSSKFLVPLTEVVTEGCEFVKKCKKQGIEVAIISNWDPESFTLLKAHLPKFFALFDEQYVIIPQMVGKTKPSTEIYAHMIKVLGVELSECFFVDDSRANVEGAQCYGIKAVHHKNWQDTENQLKMMGLILGNV
jgi:FMN phosphatase YigB (HAD superfamily)